VSEKEKEPSEAKEEKAEKERGEAAERGRKGSEEREEKDIVEERFYRVPLRPAWTFPVKKRAPKAMRVLRGFVQKHMKVEDLVIGTDVSERVWSRGIEKPPRSVRVRVVKDKEGVVTVYLAE